MLCPTCQSANPDGAPSCRSCGSPLATTSTPAQSTINADAPDALPAGTLLGGLYKIERVLGQGGFGITYACRDTLLQRKVAVKEFFPFGCRRDTSQVLPSRSISPTDFTSARDKFLDEARILAACSHRGIVAVHTAFSENNTAYMVMELLQGQTLGEVLANRGGRLPEDETVTLAEAICDALCYVHDRGLLHRDLKPENVMLCDDSRVMLIDFGTAREYSKGHLQVRGHTVVVTPGYAPLEQYAQQARRGPYTDIYALCALIYHLLTGQVPVAASDRAMGVLLSPVRELNPRISKRVARAIETGLQIEVDKRPQSVGEFLDLLHREVEPESHKSHGWDAPLPLQAEADRIRREKQERRSKNKAAINLADDEFINRYLPPTEESVPIGTVAFDPQTQKPCFVNFADAHQQPQSLLNETTQPQPATSASASTQATPPNPSPAVAPTDLPLGNDAATFALRASLLNATPDPNPLPLATPTVGAPTTLQKTSSQTPVPNAQNAGGVAHRNAQVFNSDANAWVQILAVIFFLFGVWLTVRILAPSPPQSPRTSTHFGQLPSTTETTTQSIPEAQTSAQYEKYSESFKALRQKEEATTSSGPFFARPEIIELPYPKADSSNGAFSPDGRLVAYGSHSGLLILLDLKTRKTIRILKTAGGRDLQFSPDGKFLVDSASTSATVWDVQSGKKLKTLPIDSIGDYIHTLNFPTPDSIRLTVVRTRGAADQSRLSVVTWNWRTGKHQAFKSPDSVGTYYPPLSLTPNHSSIIISSNNDSTIEEFDWKKQRLIRSKQLIPRHLNFRIYDWQKDDGLWGAVTSTHHSSDGLLLAVAQNSQDLWMLDKNWKVKWQSFVPPRSNGVMDAEAPSLQFSPSQKWLLHNSPSLRIFETSSGKLVQYVPLVNYLTQGEMFSSSFPSSIFSPDEKRIYQLTSYTLNIWRLKASAEVKTQQEIESADNSGQVTPPATLSQTYEEWKKAYASQDIARTVNFYDSDAKFEGVFQGLTREGFRNRLLSRPEQNWHKINDREEPRFYRTSHGYLLRAHLDYAESQQAVKAHGERTLLWKRIGTRWVITVDHVGEYQDIVS